MTRVSVVIPSRNGRHLLPFCLDPLLCQQADDVEILVVDDGSTDGTKAWMAAKYPFCECLALPCASPNLDPLRRQALVPMVESADR